MGLKLPVRPKFFLAYMFVGHEFSQEKVLKKTPEVTGIRERSDEPVWHQQNGGKTFRVFVTAL